MARKKRNRVILLSVFIAAAIPLFLGITTAQARKKAAVKIPKDRKKITTPLKEPVGKEVKAEEIKAEVKEETVQADYSYDPANKVDPFKSFIIVKKELEEKERPKTYLETLDLSQVTLSAIVMSEEGNWALVRDSKGEGHVIKVGTSIGRKRGRVIKILEKEVVVREYYRDIRGREEIPKDISISLPSVD